MTTTPFDRWIQRGGQAKLDFGLAIEGVRELFVTSLLRSHRGALPWGSIQDRVAYEGLSPDGIRTEESGDWTTAELKASGVTVRIQDTEPDRAATRVFGGRTPTRKTFLAADLSESATSVEVVSTLGWPTIGGTTAALYIGRETVTYTGSDSNTFTGCTRGAYGSLAHRHSTSTDGATDSTIIGEVEVTDCPISLIGRRAQLYVFVDEETSGTVIWRGIVRAVRQTGDGLGWEVTLGHISELLNQKVGASVQPFPMRGYYFPTTRPFRLTIEEKDSASVAGVTARTCTVEISGYQATLEDLLHKINDLIDVTGSTWLNTSGTPTAPTNTDYRLELSDNGTILAIRFRTHGATPRWAEMKSENGIPGLYAWAPEARNEDGSVAFSVSADNWYTLIGADPGVVPDAYADIAPRSYAEAPEDGTPTAGNRLYHAHDDLPTLEYVRLTGGAIAGGAGGRDLDIRFRVVSQGTGYLEVAAEGRLDAVRRLRISSYADNPVIIHPVLLFLTQRWDEMLRGLADATVENGPTGEQPWLPTAEFDWTDIAREVEGAGGALFAKEWRILSTTDLADLVQPELLMQGFCWTTTESGILTVKPVAVASGATFTTVHIDETDSYSPSSQATPTITDSPEGHVNDVVIKSGWDPVKEEFTRSDVGARMKASWQNFGRKTLRIEPRGSDIQATLLADADARAMMARTLVNTFAYPYFVARIPGVSARYATTLLGAMVAITDRRLCWLGTRGVSLARGQVVARAVDWSTGVVDLEVRLSDWNAAAYAPAARIRSDGSGLTNSNLTVEYRGENAFSPVPNDSSTFYDGFYFQVGDVCRIRQLDTTTAAEQAGLTIVSVDRANKKVTFNTAVTADINTATKRFVLEFTTWDESDGEGAAWDTTTKRIPATPQRDYGYIADTNHKLGIDNDQAKLWGA